MNVTNQIVLRVLYIEMERAGYQSFRMQIWNYWWSSSRSMSTSTMEDILNLVNNIAMSVLGKWAIIPKEELSIIYIVRIMHGSQRKQQKMNPSIIFIPDHI